MAQDHAGIVVLHAGHDVDKILQIQRRLGHPQEQQLKHAVVHTDAGGIQLHKPAQRRGVAHGTEDELSLKAFAVGLHRAAVGAQGVQIAQPLQNVGEVPQRVFGCLGRGVGGAGKGAEGRHIRKVPVVVPSHVQRVRRTADGGAGGLVHGGGKMQTGGEVVGAAAGQIAQGRALGQLHNAGQRLVQRAVAAGAHDQVIVAAAPGGHVTRLPAGLRNENVHQIAGAGELCRRVKQRGTGFCLSCTGIDDKQELFHGDTLPYHRILRGVVRL